MVARLPRHWKTGTPSQRRLLRPEWSRSHSRNEPITFENCAPLSKPSGDEDSPLLPSRKRPSLTFFGDLRSSSDSGGVMSRFPGYSGRPRSNWTASGSPLLASPNPENREDYPCSEPHSTKRPCDLFVLVAPPTQRPRAVSREGRGEAEKEFRERYQLSLYGPQSFTQQTATLDIEQALRNPLEGWHPNEITFPMGEPSLRARNLTFDVTFQQIPTRHIFVTALTACGVKRVITHDSRMLNSARELGAPRREYRV